MVLRRIIIASSMLLLSCGVWLAALSARADDVADEADLHFNLGTERYERRDYNGALSHFLASNRLAKNRNVLFNIALCYESLGQLPEAYRYYTRSLEGETDAATVARIKASLSRLAPRVPLLHIVTDPPGAHLYIDRRDLGERGAAPQTMALPPGTYRVFAELEGYELAESEPVELRVGVERTVSLALRRIVGTIHVPSPAGASVRLDADNAPELCRAPCDVPAPPGQHTLILAKEGYRTARVPVSIEANQVSPILVELVAESGSLVVNADEIGATLEVDGVARGAVPATFDVPAGPHRIRVSLRGFQTFEREVVVRANEPTRLDLQLVPSDLVEAASRLSESAEDAPASVSLISGQELRAMRYPTVAEAVRGTRGVYLTDDRGYVNLGFRGLQIPGSYGKRVLITLDGMPTNDDWLWGSYVGFDERADLEDIERIEIVRGPGSVVYGTSAFTGVINLVTRYRDVPSGVETGASAAADGVFRARMRLTHHFSSDSGVWISVAGGTSRGRDFFFPEYVADGPPELAGYARGLDGATFGTATGRAWWRDLSIAGSFNYHLKYLPTGQFEGLFGDGRARQWDTRGFVEARFEPHINASTTLLTRVHANLYTYRGYVPLSPDDGGIDTTYFNSYWVGAEQRVVFKPSSTWSASLGSEVQGFPKVDVRETAELDGEYLNERQRFVLAAFYANLDLRPLTHLKLSAGARLDYYSNSGASLNPRVALISEPYPGGNLKVLFGKAFIAPSADESSYAYYDRLNNPNLEPENIYSAEVEWSHRLTPLVVATAAAYSNYYTDLIALVALPANAEGALLNQYQNTRTPIGTLGFEAEVRRDWKEGWMVAGSYSLQRSAYLRSRRLTDLLTLERSAEFREVPDSPAHLASLRAAAPLLARALRVMSRISLESGRHDRNALSESESLQTRTKGALLWDIVLSGTAERLGLDYSLGLYNALDWNSEHPVSDEFRQLSIPITRRSILIAANVSF
jgi:outer membrane receptor protein involved in Fe transport